MRHTFTRVRLAVGVRIVTFGLWVMGQPAIVKAK